MTNIPRRAFLAGTAASGVALAASFPKPAIAANTIQWTMALAWQELMPGFASGAKRLAKRIAELSDGQLEIKVSNVDDIVSDKGIFDAVAKNTVEMGHSLSCYWQNKSRAMSFFSGVPGGFTAQEQNGWLYFGGGKNLWDELYAQFGLIAFPAGNTGYKIGGWFNQKVSSISDFKDLKIRMPGLAGDVLKEFGSTIKTIEPQELFTSLQSGIVDGLEWAGPWSDMALGFHRVSKYYYWPSFSGGGATLELVINKKAFDNLPKNLQQIVKVACMAENDSLTAEFHANNIHAFNVLKYKHKIDIRKYSDSVSKSLFEASKDVVASVAKAGGLEKRIYESYEEYRKYTLEMANYSDMQFIKERV
ncbi:MAG: dicarboxylate transporter-DctP subunit [Rickettsiaceae bacterium]|jgi:TRAP-type mannitol/chloroaromatic compound transport system substrate-binding protein|nr:dicarboxylate transporter-DctP subunit [Rickettsiaceae bacterium]